jgi:DNA repair exonuclease SbcCD nuclease subunit
MRFIHTADWQIGKPFRSFGTAEPLLQQARLAAIEAIGALARAEGVADVLIAGDLYDSEQPSRRTLLEPLERMRSFPQVAWHVISGNHDPHRANGLWDRVRAAGPPANLHLHLDPVPSPLGDEAVLLPAPMRRKSEVSDLTQWMDGAETAPGLIRIGLAHGSAQGFGADGEASNPIAPDRAQSARLDYLALGDWHRTLKIGERTWYSGTHEADGFAGQEVGKVLVVEIDGPGAAPRVSEHRTGTYRWLSMTEQVTAATDVAALDAKIRALTDLSAVVLRLSLIGSLPLDARAALDGQLAGLDAAMAHLDTDLEQLHVRPTQEDIERIDFDGVLREAAGALRELAEDETKSASERRHAEDALVELFLLSARTAGGEAP